MTLTSTYNYIMRLIRFSLLFVFALPSCAQDFAEDSKNAPLKSSLKRDDSKMSDTFTLIAVGDIMMGTNFPDASYLPPEGTYLLDPLKNVLRNADITFGNLEGSILNDGGELKSCSDWTKCYAFRQPEYFAAQLKDAGFDLLSIANNHLGDFGETGRKNTMKVLKENGFCYAGQEKKPWDTLTVNGLKIGFTAFAPNSGCLKITDYTKVKEIIGILNEMCDIVVVSFHGGAEGSSKTHITRQTEIFYDEDRGNVYEFARIAIDSGADVILGHGPHVTRAIDHYKGKFISYSMGNFCTYHRFNLKGVNGIAPVFKLKLKKDGTFIDGEIISIKQLGEGGPVLDESNGALEQIKILTNEDIPELKVTFGANNSFRFD
jgi:poly-gamma-glutamate capsule biosynthesis protein CapA/YwtB (metallophosphatase superfamily)